MIFPATIARKVLAGEVTLTVRPRGRYPYRTTRTYRLERPARRDEMTSRELVQHDQGRPAPPVTIGHVAITSAEIITLGEVTNAAAILAGFENVGGLLDHWFATHERLRRSDEAWDRVYDRVVWLLTIQPVRVEQPVYLRVGVAPAGTSVDYTTEKRHAAPGEPEVVSAHDLDQLARRSETEFQRLEQQRALDRRLLAVEDRVRAVRQDARMRSVDVSREMRHVETALRQGRSRAAVLRELERAERRVYPRAA